MDLDSEEDGMGEFGVDAAEESGDLVGGLMNRGEREQELAVEPRRGEDERGARSEGRLQRSDSNSNIAPTNITINLPLAASLLAIPHPNPFCDSLRSSQLQTKRLMTGC